MSNIIAASSSSAAIYSATLNITTKYLYGYGEKGGKRAVITNGAIMRGVPRVWIQWIPTEGFIFFNGQPIMAIEAWMYKMTGETGLPVMFRAGLRDIEVRVPTVNRDGSRSLESTFPESRDQEDQIIADVMGDDEIVSVIIHWYGSPENPWMFDTQVTTTTNNNESLGVDVPVFLVEFSTQSFHGAKIKVDGGEVNAVTSEHVGAATETGLKAVRSNVSRSQKKREAKKQFYRELKERLEHGGPPIEGDIIDNV